MYKPMPANLHLLKISPEIAPFSFFFIFFIHTLLTEELLLQKRPEKMFLSCLSDSKKGFFTLLIKIKKVTVADAPVTFPEKEKIYFLNFILFVGTCIMIIPIFILLAF